MKRSLFFILFVFITGIRVQASGGPDAYGYTWMTNLDPGGPAHQFFDISGYGTLVTGLADDNSTAGMINIGFPFHFYWTDYSQVKIGSNGWVSFSNVSNIASCFPTIPTPGGPDDYLAPFMSDLNFTGAGNPGQVFTYTNNIDTFIIMYKNVPFWSVNAPGWMGSNSFEVVLCASDSSVTYHYQNLGGFQNNAACIDMTVGIENSTGSVGLQVHSDAMPPSNYTIQFKYPHTVLLSIQDIAASWNQNNQNKAIFYPFGNISLTSNIKNAGNTNVSTPINTTCNIKNLSGTSIFTSSNTLNFLAAGDDSTFAYPAQPNITSGGEYYFETTVSNTSDINSGNNILNTEIEVVNICATSFTLSYTNNGNTPDGSLNWNGGANDDGFAVHIVPPVYPVNLTQMDVYVTSNVFDGFLTRVYADDGPGGAPGTLLYSGSMASATIISNAWNAHSITPQVINSGGFYLTFLQTGTTIFAGTYSSSYGPVSRRNYEILDGGWGAYRNNQTADIAVRCQVSYPYHAGPAQPGPITGNINMCEGAPTTLYSVSPVASATSYTWNLPAGWSGTSTADTIQATPGTTGGTISVSSSGLCGSSTSSTFNVFVNPPPTVIAQATDSTVCTGDQIILSGGGATSYLWTGSVTDGVAFTPATTGTYTVTGTDGNNCSNTAAITITVNNLPVISANTTNDTICNGSPVTLTGAGASSYTWTGSVTDNTPFTPGATGTYTVTGTDGNNCSNTATIMVAVNPLPNVIANASDNFICTGDTVVLTGGGAVSYLWSGSVTDGVFFIPAATGAYTVTGTNGNGCSNTDSVTVTVNPLPSVTFTYPGNDTICTSNGSQTLTGGSPAGGIYSGTGVSGSSFDPATAGPGSHTLTYAYTDGNGCSNTSDASIVVLGCAGLETNGENTVEVYPNPFTDMITITHLPEASKISLYNAWGQEIESRMVTENNWIMHTSHLSPGMYFLSVQTTQGTVTRRIIKK